jgi:hypothetical protein
VNTETTETVLLSDLRTSRDRYILSTAESARELSRVAESLAEAITEGGGAVGLIMEVTLLTAMVQAQWAEARAVNRFIQQTEMETDNASDT